ncbi:MAG TPA: PHP domain-containing protein [Candidatus Krumholzibacteria bacterium]|nr:PHP domain-containing protein [Candidatus Krumholzibacteria bacterium]
MSSTNDKRIDMHMHSTYSDGVRTPAELIAMARSKGLAGLALTDHDSIEGFRELSAAAAGAGVEVMTGVELSCEYNGKDLHVLAYGVDADNVALQSLLRDFRGARERRGERIVEKLAEQGVHIDMERVKAKAGNGSLGRPHIAEALIEAGYVPDHAQAFARYIGEGCPAHVDKFKMQPEQAVQSIHAARGLAFVAHPGYYMEDFDAFLRLLDAGFDGVEVFHPYHIPPVITRLLALARDRGLLISGGSDFHGFAGRDNMGEPAVPHALFERIQETLVERRKAR